jgi:hypothetical protein
MTMTEHTLRVLRLLVVASSTLGMPAIAQQTASFTYSQAQEVRDRPGLVERGGWIESANEGRQRPGSQRRSRVRLRAELQFRTALLDRTGVPSYVTAAMRPALGALAVAASNRPFDLSGVEEVDSGETADGGYRVVLALPASNVGPVVGFDRIISYLDREVGRDRPLQDPLLLFELSAEPDLVRLRVVAAMARLYGQGFIDAIEGKPIRWERIPSWIRSSPRPVSENECSNKPTDELIKLVASRPDDQTPRLVLGERLRAAGFERSATLFLGTQPRFQWQPLDAAGEQAVKDIAGLKSYIGVDCAWLEGLIRTCGHFPWKENGVPSTTLSTAKARFAAGNVRAAGVEFIKVLESGESAEALSYLSSVCFEAKLHRLGAVLGGLACEADSRLPYAGVNELRNLVELGDRDGVKAIIDRVAGSKSLDAWGRRELERIRGWLEQPPTSSD